MMAYQQLIRGAPIAPLPLMGAGAILALLMTLAALVFVERQPWLGVGVAYDTEAGFPVIDEVYHHQFSSVELSPGDRVTALISEQAGRFSLRGFDPGLEPSGFSRFVDQAKYFEHSARVAKLLSSGAKLEINGQRRVSVSLIDERALKSFPADFWLLNFFGMVVWIVGLSVFAARPREPAARMLCLSSGGFIVSCIFNSIYVCRELGIYGDVLALLSRGNRIGLLVMLFAILALMARFPNKITRNPPELYASAAFILTLSNEWYQMFDLPLHSFFLPIYAMYAIGVAIAFCQWRVSRGRPVDRAALKWMLLAVFIIMGAGLTIYYIPLTLRAAPIVPEWMLVAVASLLYVGFALGIIRYRLFQVDRWWLRIWSWFLGGLSIVLVDLALITYLQVQPPVALMVAVVIVGWLYFPLRQWAWASLVVGASGSQQDPVQMVEEIAGVVPSGEVNEKWESILSRSFRPAAIESSATRLTNVCLADNGTHMDVPLFGDCGRLRLLYANNGKRLFSPDDQVFVESLFGVMLRILKVHRQEMEAVQQERQRIVRDLHDDVGGQLLSLLHQSPNDHYASLARNALRSLRESMKAIDSDALQEAPGCMGDWRAEVEERLCSTRVELDWSQNLEAGPRKFSVRQGINLRRILLEAITNALQHARPTIIRVAMISDGQNLEITVWNDGVVQREESNCVTRGRGLNNMQTRAAELGGLAEFWVDGDHACVRAVIPLVL